MCSCHKLKSFTISPRISFSNYDWRLPDQTIGKLDLRHSDSSTKHEDVIVAALDQGRGELVGDGLVVVVDDDQLALLVLVVEHFSEKKIKTKKLTWN